MIGSGSARRSPRRAEDSTRDGMIGISKPTAARAPTHHRLSAHGSESSGWSLPGVDGIAEDVPPKQR